jgi:hypothetical protein
MDSDLLFTFATGFTMKDLETNRMKNGCNRSGNKTVGVEYGAPEEITDKT